MIPAIWLRVWRLGVLVVLGLLVYSQARWRSAHGPSSVSLGIAREFFPSAQRVQLKDPDLGVHLVTDQRGEPLGNLLTTSPATDHIIGYSGPNNLLVALDRDGAVAGLKLLASGDTPDHVRRVTNSPGFLPALKGWNPARQPFPEAAAVSGATLTRSAMAEALQLRLSGASISLRFPEPVRLAEAQSFFTNAARITPESARLRIQDQGGTILGYLIRTSPHGDNVTGYRGPSEVLLALSPAGDTVVGARTRRSFDTPSYVTQVDASREFWSRYLGRSISEITNLTALPDRIAGISGATRTAAAIDRGIRDRLAHAVRPERPDPEGSWRPGPREWGLAATVLGACLLAFTPLRGNRWLRIGWQVFLVAYVGLTCRDMLSLSLAAGWVRNGPAFETVPGLVLLALAALVLPWGTRRNVYCHHLCPHGAAQQLMGAFTRRRFSFQAAWMTRFEWIPGVLIALAFFAVLTGRDWDLAQWEPFDAWNLQSAGWVTGLIAAGGLALALFIPQAYCRFGCPTGGILAFIRSAGSADRWGLRDTAALLLLAAGCVVSASSRRGTPDEARNAPSTWHGKTMGTTWSLQVLGEDTDPAVLHRLVTNELEWAESMISHWRTNTDLSVFNRSATTNPLPVPWPVLRLVQWSTEVSRQTGGAFDTTVGPLVRLWGFGPGPRRAAFPTASEIEELRGHLGWQKLELLDGLLRKQDPAIQVDLSAIGEGWAVDRVSSALDFRGVERYLIEVGGEIRARGVWTVAIEHPLRPVTLRDEALATSGVYRQRRVTAGRSYSHLIDARTGYPVRHRTVSVSVRADDCAQADVWSTALNVLGRAEGFPLAERLGLAAAFVEDQPEGPPQVHLTTGWRQREARVLQNQGTNAVTPAAPPRNGPGSGR